MKLRIALAAATCLAAPVFAHAQPVVGPYISLGGGYNILSSVKGYNDFEESQAKITFHNGYDVVASVGYGFGFGTRMEVEGDYTNNTLDKGKYSFGTYGATGSENKYGGFVNVLYDIDLGGPIYPYVGAGVGYQEINLKSTSLVDGEYFINQTKGSFAFQGIAGLALPIAVVPGLSLTAEYRYVDDVQGNDFHGTTFEDTRTSQKFGKQVNQSFNLGLRYAFGVAAPIVAHPKAAPAPSGAKTYLVFFDWNKYNLTPRATQIIAEAATDSHSQKVTTINVSGYTDTSGTVTYNQGLSERRAKAVADRLIADGVKPSEIETHAFGETHLLVPTGPGVREPQNRRVEIVLN